MRTLVPFTAVIAYQSLPETAVPQVADQEPPVTVPVAVTTVPVGMLTSEVADVEGNDRRRTVQLVA